LAYDNFANGFKYGNFSEGGNTYYNISYNNGAAGYEFDGELGGPGMYIDAVYNNVDYGSVRGFWVDCDDTDTLTITNFKNNTFSGETVGAYIVDNSTGSVTFTNYTNNNVYATTDYTNFPGGDQTGTNDNISVDPLFTAAATYDFTLQSGSPMIDAGVNVSLVLDYAGNTVPFNAKPSTAGTYDIGAYEYQFIIQTTLPAYLRYKSKYKQGYLKY